jgi:hypothetical protein
MKKRDRMADGDVTLLKGMAMEIVVGPVITRKGGYAFDCWTPEEGFSRGYAYCRVEDAYYARNVEIRSHNKSYSDRMIACNTVDEFMRLTI